MKKLFAPALCALVFAAPAVASETEEARFCPDRPDLAISACIVPPGSAVLEVSAVDWERVTFDHEREDKVLAGSFVLRAGVTETTEVRVGWTPYGHVRIADEAHHEVHEYEGVGDVYVGVKQSLANPSGHGFAVALLPYATLPTGDHHIGAGDWGAGLALPISYSIGEGVEIAAMPQVRAAVDEDRDGRHLAYGGVVGLITELGHGIDSALEMKVERDRDPHGHATDWLAAASLAWEPRHGLQFDIGGEIGLNAESPDFRILTGFATAL
ncbi:transporter [Stakelama marina]|uniref:Transporter n=1 Tax=Stakelama marina TaxID=2826939 RepID=A0A8T4IBG5_9SPHN|nr:transporter [Stakelama marina]MBR0551164.1 transporter [Stakelama marina]